MAAVGHGATAASHPSNPDRYERLRLLGEGSYGKIWVVREKGHHAAQYVMKEIRPVDQQELHDAITEADIMHKLKHPHIIEYREVMNVTPKLVLIVMEYAAHGDVAHRIEQEKTAGRHLPEATVLQWTAQTLEGLAFLHAAGVVHRDIKAANLFLSASDDIKLGDFGVSRELDANATRMTQRTCSTPVGTPMYMAPEMCTGSDYGQRADIWALGCVLYEMLTLRPAFAAQTMQSLLQRIKRGRVDLDRIPEAYTQGPRDLLAAMLTVDPLHRPTARELLDWPLLRPFVAPPDSHRHPVLPTRRPSHLASFLPPPPRGLTNLPVLEEGVTPDPSPALRRRHAPSDAPGHQQPPPPPQQQQQQSQLRLPAVSPPPQANNNNNNETAAWLHVHRFNPPARLAGLRADAAAAATAAAATAANQPTVKSLPVWPPAHSPSRLLQPATVAAITVSDTAADGYIEHETMYGTAATVELGEGLAGPRPWPHHHARAPHQHHRHPGGGGGGRQPRKGSILELSEWYAKHRRPGDSHEHPPRR